MEIVSNLFKFYFFLFVALSHTVLMTCRFHEGQVVSGQFTYKEIPATFATEKCPKVRSCFCCFNWPNPFIFVGLAPRGDLSSLKPDGWPLPGARWLPCQTHASASAEKIPDDDRLPPTKRLPVLGGGNSPLLVIFSSSFIEELFYSATIWLCCHFGSSRKASSFWYMPPSASSSMFLSATFSLSKLNVTILCIYGLNMLLWCLIFSVVRIASTSTLTIESLRG